MSDPKWTPGPWRVDSDGTHGPVYVSQSHGERFGVAMMDGALERRRDDAALIAAAPELYEALVLCTDAMLGKVHAKNPAWLAVHNALAKARGEV